MTRSATLEIQEPRWEELFPPEQWSVYAAVLEAAQRRGIRFAIGGGTAFSHYSGRWRNSKDMDIYVVPADHEAMNDVVNGTGLTDYFEVSSYDRGWIYRSHNGKGVIVDIIWQMANYRAVVDDRWLTEGDAVRIHGMDLRFIPAEELIWAKLYVFQRDRCDLTDLVNILFGRGEHLNWGHLLARLGEDRRILAASLEMFVWVCPGRAEQFPAGLWEAMGVKPPEPGLEEVNWERVRLMDSREWFGPTK